MAPCSDADVGGGAGSKYQARATERRRSTRPEGHCGRGSASLNDVVGIDHQRRQARIVIAIDGHPVTGFAAQQMIYALQKIVKH